MLQTREAVRLRTLRHAHVFLNEFRRDVELAASQNADLPPRLRVVHEKKGHATPEFRTLNIPIPSQLGGASPEALAAAIGTYAARQPPSCLVLALDLETDDVEGGRQPLLVAEARDSLGNRFFWRQRYRADAGRIQWDECEDDGWIDPGDEEMILDAAFTGRR